jgi:hypothetical protein
MERSEALQHFGLPAEATAEEIENAIEEKLFGLKNEILQKYMVPILLHKKVNQIQDLMIAEYVLNNALTENFENSPAVWNENPPNRIVLLEQYEKQISALKLALMESATFHQTHKVIQAFILTQEYYMVLFRILFNEFTEALPEEVNTREMIDTGKLLQALKSGDPDNRLTWEIEREIARIDKLRNIKSVN